MLKAGTSGKKTPRGVCPRGIFIFKTKIIYGLCGSENDCCVYTDIVNSLRIAMHVSAGEVHRVESNADDEHTYH